MLAKASNRLQKDAIEFAKKHGKRIEKVGEQFFKDNFGLKVKATNVVGKDDGVEVYVHCEDHGIVFNASLPLYKDAIHQKGSMRSNDNGDDMSMMVGTVLSGFEYQRKKKSMITYINSSKKMKRNINIQALQKRQLTRHKTLDIKMNTLYHIFIKKLKRIS